MFKVLVDVKTFFNIRFGELQNKMTADLESLKSMSPIETKDGKSNKSTIDELTNEYLNLSSRWEAEKNRIESKMVISLVRKALIVYSYLLVCIVL